MAHCSSWAVLLALCFLANGALGVSLRGSSGLIRSAGPAAAAVPALSLKLQGQTSGAGTIAAAFAAARRLLSSAGDDHRSSYSMGSGYATDTGDAAGDDAAYASATAVSAPGRPTIRYDDQWRPFVNSGGGRVETRWDGGSERDRILVSAGMATSNLAAAGYARYAAGGRR